MTTWSRGQGVQSSPTYSGVHEVTYSDDWVYIRTTGLGGHIMGPWYLNEARTQNFPNFPANTATLYRIPRVPQVPASKVTTSLGAIGYFVDGVAMFDMRDAFSYSTADGQDATPVNGLTGNGIWNRNAYVNESVTFDAALAHQAGALYHYHAQPVALRYLLGDHVSYNATNNVYTEQAGAADHSPVLGWAADGFPIYGPYGYSNPTNPASSVTRMRSGFQIRNGTNTTVDLRVTGRTSLPAWAAAIQGRSATLIASEFGPSVSTTYILGHYLEDFSFLGDHGLTQGVDFDLDLHNGRQCVTPEFPEGTYAYFTTILKDGTPVYPHTVGRTFYGAPDGSAIAVQNEDVTIQFQGGPGIQEEIVSTAIDSGSGDVIIVWTAVEGGSYQLRTSTNLVDFNDVGAPTNASTTMLSQRDGGGATGQTTAFYQVTRTALAAYDDTGFTRTSTNDPPVSGDAVFPNSGALGATVSLTITLDVDAVPPLPPTFVPITSVTVGPINATILNRSSETHVTCQLSIPVNAATGTQDVVVTFAAPPDMPSPSYTFVNAFTIQN